MISIITKIWEGIFGGLHIFILLLLPPLRSNLRSWGSTEDDIHRELPGDELVMHVKGWYNHAITINAKPADVWPWIVQLGQNKGGFYSYDYLENIVGCKIHSADKIIPQFQDTRVGDKVMMTPKKATYIVEDIDHNKAFILRLRVNLQTQETVVNTHPLPEKYQDSSWVFYLEETLEGTTRLISRSRNEWNNSKTNTVFYGIFGVISLVMDKKTLIGIKKRAEAVL